MLKLRDYQEECVQLVLRQYHVNPHGNELIVLPTGAGKTVVFSHVIHTLAREYGLNTLIIAHRDELLDQAADKYHMTNPTAIIGKVGSGICQYGGEVTVASIATISRPNHIKQLKAIGYGLIIIDEAHHSAASGYQRVLEALPDAFVLMVTATPDRLDKKLVADGKTPLYQKSIIDMITRGYLCDMRAIAIRTEVNLDEIKTRAGDFSQEELDLAVNTPARNKRVVSAYEEHCSGKRAICFAVTVAHAQALAYAFNEAGINAAVITGNTPIEARKQIYAKLRSGEILVICNVQVLTEGFDEPTVECVIMARPTQSRALYVQCVGRGLRLAPDKPYCTILDLTDNCLKHRLMPVNLRKALDIHIRNQETVEQALAREEQEAKEKEALVIKLKQKRVKDIVIDLLQVLEWNELENGTFVMEVGRSKHRVALVPTKHDADQYEVWARLAPHFRGQKWVGAQPLEQAQQLAERRIRMLHNDERSKDFFDKESPRRQQKIDPNGKQVAALKWYKIPWTRDMTRGEASDLIDAHKDEIERKKAVREARKQQKQKQIQGVS